MNQAKMKRMRFGEMMTRGRIVITLSLIFAAEQQMRWTRTQLDRDKVTFGEILSPASAKPQNLKNDIGRSEGTNSLISGFPARPRFSDLASECISFCAVSLVLEIYSSLQSFPSNADYRLLVDAVAVATAAL